MSIPYDIELLKKLSAETMAVASRLRKQSVDDYASFIGMRSFKANQDIISTCNLWETHQYEHKEYLKRHFSRESK